MWQRLGCRRWCTGLEVSTLVYAFTLHIGVFGHPGHLHHLLSSPIVLSARATSAKQHCNGRETTYPSHPSCLAFL